MLMHRCQCKSAALAVSAVLVNTYDSLGRVKNQLNARSKSYDYYFAGSRSEEVGPGGSSRISYLDALGNVLQSSTPLGYWTVSAYDGQSRLVSRQLPEGNAMQVTYDDASCASADKRCTHNVKTVTTVAKPGSPLAALSRSFTYEGAFNKVASATDAMGKVTTYAYNAQGLPLTVTSPVDDASVAPQTTYAYSAFTPSGYPTFYLPASQTVKTTSANATVSTTGYNAANNYVPQTSTADAGTGKLNLASTLTYDAVGNLTLFDGPRSDVADTVAIAYDSERRPIQRTDAAGKQTKIAYDADGRPVKSAAQIGAQWLVSCTQYSETGKVTRA